MQLFASLQFRTQKFFFVINCIHQWKESFIGRQEVLTFPATNKIKLSYSGEESLCSPSRFLTIAPLTNRVKFCLNILQDNEHVTLSMGWKWVPLTYMGRFPQDGSLPWYMSFFWKLWRLAVALSDQLGHFFNCSWEILSCGINRKPKLPPTSSLDCTALNFMQMLHCPIFVWSLVQSSAAQWICGW